MKVKCKTSLLHFHAVNGKEPKMVEQSALVSSVIRAMYGNDDFLPLEISIDKNRGFQIEILLTLNFCVTAGLDKIPVKTAKSVSSIPFDPFVSEH